MRFWRPGIMGKLFLAIFATCILLLITMHWAVRFSFERGFIDYIKTRQRTAAGAAKRRAERSVSAARRLGVPAP